MMLPLQVLAVVFFTAVAVGNISAQGEETDQDGDIVVTVTIKKVKQDIDNLREKLNESKKKAEEAAQSLQSADEESRPRLDQTFKAADNDRKLLSETIAQTERLVALAEAPGHEAERRELLQKAVTLTSVIHLTSRSMQLHTDFLNELKQAAETSQGAASSPSERAAKYRADVFSASRKGGGVFLDRVAEMPIASNTVIRAEYDLGLGRFVLHQSGRRLFLQQTDPDLTATVVSCLYYPEPRNKVAVSMNIDPVSMGIVRTSVYDHDEVLFGCERLWNTEAGRILIDADDLLARIWMGKNRLGEDLTRKYHYHSLAQMMLDHPMMPDMAHDVPLVNRKINMRVWIRPERIFTRLIGNDLVFDDVAFHLYTETLTKSDPRMFQGAAYPNPGADVFAAFFNQNFSRFAHMAVRDDDRTGRKFRPFEELPEVARIAGVVSWIKNSGIPMDASWAAGYPVAETLTRPNLPIIPVHDVEKEITPPIVIYNQYGPSRVIDKKGRMFMYTYDDTGRFVKLVRITKDDKGHIIEMPDTLVSGTTGGRKAQ